MNNPKEVKAECYLVMESNGDCLGIRFKLPSGEYFGQEFRPHPIKLLKGSNTGQIPDANK
jgi:hypothetical protein